MAITNNSYQPYTPQPYVNINTPSYSFLGNGPTISFVNSEREALSRPNPINGCSFFIDGENLILYVKYADGREMETYDLVQRKPEIIDSQSPSYVTADELSKILDEKLDALSKKFVLRRDNKESRGNQNG